MAHWIVKVADLREKFRLATAKARITHWTPKDKRCVFISQVYELMRKCWEHAPEKRITFKRLIEELTILQQHLQQNSL